MDIRRRVEMYIVNYNIGPTIKNRGKEEGRMILDMWRKRGG